MEEEKDKLLSLFKEYFGLFGQSVLEETLKEHNIRSFKELDAGEKRIFAEEIVGTVFGSIVSISRLSVIRAKVYSALGISVPVNESQYRYK